MAHTVFHIEDESPEFQSEVFRLIGLAAEAGIQLTPLDFRNVQDQPELDGVPADQWVEAMTMD